MSDATEALLERAADQIDASEIRCVTAEVSRRQSDLYIATSREAIRRSHDQLARLAATER